MLQYLPDETNLFFCEFIDICNYQSITSFTSHYYSLIQKFEIYRI